MCMRHVPVLLNEVVEGLDLKSGDRVIDCTLGDAGHAEKILEAINPQGTLLGIDADPEALLRAKQYLYRFGERAQFVRDNFVHLKTIAEKHNFTPVNAILMDLGWSSPQFAERGRGFSFQNDEPLDMRYGGSSAAGLQTSAELLATAPREELERIFREYGEEKLSREIAAAIMGSRADAPIERTGQLTEIILETYRKKLHSKKEIPWIGGLHPATKIFQALRIAVNDEFGVLETVLPQAIDILAPGGRLAVITFHSGEDRMVKHFFKKYQGKLLTLITAKPIVPSEQEVEHNPRAGSAKLRIIQKL